MFEVQRERAADSGAVRSVRMVKRYGASREQAAADDESVDFVVWDVVVLRL